MTTTQPETDLDARYSDPAAVAVDWFEASEAVGAAELYWVSTVRPDGRPHVTPLIGVWLDEQAYFCTGPEERKARNLHENRHCVLTTGCNELDQGLDVIIEGEAVPVTAADALRRVADAYVAKYGETWRFELRDGGFVHEEGTAEVYRVAPSVAFAFGRGPVGSQTRYRF